MRGKIVFGVACGLELSAMVHSATASVLYRQNFSATAGMTPFSAVNWNPYYGNSSTGAALATPGNSGTTANAMLSAGPSAPTSGPNVNAGYTTATTTDGFGVVLSNNGTQQFAIYTNEYTINSSAESSLSFSWYAATGYSGGDSQTLIIQMDGNWYASTSPITALPTIASNGMSFAASAEQFTTTFSTSASAWRTLDFSPGSDLTLGSSLSQSLPTDNITAFGIYADLGSDNASARTYFDTFEVDSSTVPEPATVALAVVGAAPLLLRRQRRD